MTALLVLAGLYPPSPIQQWNDDLEWMPIPYHFERGEHDYVSFMVCACVALKQSYFSLSDVLRRTVQTI